MSVAAERFHPSTGGEFTDGGRHLDEGSQQALSATAAVLARVRRLAQRRLAWLEHLSESGQGGSSSNSDVSALLDDLDNPDLERRWTAADSGLARLEREIDALGEALAGDTVSALARLVKEFGLSNSERDLVHVCLAVELDPGLNTLYGVLQGSSTRGFATMELAAKLCGWPREPQVRSGGPLLRWDIVRVSDGSAGEPSSLRLDPHIVDFLCERYTLDPDLIGIAQPVAVHDPIQGWPVDSIATTLQRALEHGAAVRLAIKGPPGSGRRTFAAAIARKLGCGLLAIDTTSISDAEWPATFRRAQRQALLFGLLLVWHGEGLSRRWPAVPSLAPVQFVTGEADLLLPAAPGFLDEQVTLPRPSIDERAALWRRFVPVSQAWPPTDLVSIAERYQVEVGDITAIARRGVDSVARARELCRGVTRDRLGELGQLLECPFTLDDLVLPPTLRERIDELLFEARERGRFWESQAAKRLFPRGTGLIALMTGSPGTGKTMAAQVIASELGLDLFRIDLATSISKYIGETAKHLRKIFQRAADMNAVLLFDEADALFSKRTEVRDAHDRYANTDTNYLLQLLEDFGGIALLSSNKKQNMDTAFVRRIRYVLDFPRPEPNERLVLWRRITAELAGAEAAAELEPGLVKLARVVDVTGAQVKLSLLVALFLARQDGKSLGLEHLVRGVSRELSKEGRGIGPSERERIGLRG